ncbi:MAG: sulfite exporter TauE/SafE family protein [Planctomycetia bacterium]|jgi:uncharacterized membrane protein YfcA
MPWVVVIVFCIAFVFSMLGLGGSTLYVPILYWFGHDLKSVAIPTALFINGVTALSAFSYYFRAKLVDVRGGAPMIVTAFLGAMTGSWFTEKIPTQLLLILFSLALAATGLKMFASANSKKRKPMMPVRQRMIVTGVGGFFIGAIAGMLGVGGGFLVVTLLVAVGYPMKTAAATTTFVVIFSSFSGFLGHMAQGNFDIPLLIWTSAAVVIASQIGARVMNKKMDPKWLRRLLGIVLFGMALELFFGFIFGG